LAPRRIRLGLLITLDGSGLLLGERVEARQLGPGECQCGMVAAEIGLIGRYDLRLFRQLCLGIILPGSLGDRAKDRGNKAGTLRFAVLPCPPRRAGNAGSTGA